MKLSILPFVALASAFSSTEQQTPLQDSNHHKAFNIAIIGAGAAGSSTAYHINKFANSSSSPINISIFERNHYIGGRSTTVSTYNSSSQPVELGASIFVSVNKILASAVAEFNLSTSTIQETRRLESIPGPSLAIWDGQKIVLTQYGGYWDYARLWWRYGTTPLKTLNLMKKTVGKFLQMYEEPVFPWKQGLSEAAQVVGLTAVTAATGEQYIRENGIQGAFAREVVQAATRVNYAQNLGAIHGLEAMVSMAADGAMAVEGGNWRIFEYMVRDSGADLRLATSVIAIEKVKNGTFLLSYGDNEGQQLFDAVVVASPWQYAGIDVSSLGLDREPDTVPYVELHVTLFTSPHLLSPAFFNLAPGEPAPQVVLTTLPEGEPPKRGSEGVGSPGFFSISLLRPTTNPETGAEEYLYKIFSPEPVNATFLASLLGVQDRSESDPDKVDEKDVTWIYRKVWNSYPYEYPRVTFEDAEVAENFWYTGGMDSFISTMETNALMGMNVARLLVDQWGSKKDAVVMSEDELVPHGDLW